MADSPISIGLPVDFQEAIAWAKSRGITLPEDFYKQLQENSKNGAFTVSGLAGLSQIQSTLDSLNVALKNGETFADWQKKAGDIIGGLSDSHAETIFRNFIQQAYNTGRWTQFEKNKDNRPYLMFSAVNDNRTTDICRHRNGIIRPVDDKWWATNSPQLHHKCRSTLISLTASQATARSGSDTGLNQSNPTDSPSQGWGHKPTGDDVAAGLAAAIANSAQKAPAGWLESIIGFFSFGWNALMDWLSKLL